MINLKDLLPCPFCGSTAIARVIDHQVIWVTCTSCGGSGPFSPLKPQESDTTWNTRAPAGCRRVQVSDTEIIEWLDARADLYGELETSTIQFPHVGTLDGYEHIREALKEAYLQDNGGQS